MAFILCALPTGMIIAALTPPGQSPDEPAHVARAASLLHGAILGVRKTIPDPNNGQPMQVTGLKVDKGIVTFSVDHTPRIDGRPVVTLDWYNQTHLAPSDHQKRFIRLPNTATYLPVAYLPAAAGLAAGVICQQPPWVDLLLARLGNLAALLALGVAALAITAYGEALLLAVLLLPITLFLAGTVNEDGVLIGLVCLTCAALTRTERRWRLTGVALLALFVCSKPPYAPLLLVLALPLMRAGLPQRAREVLIAALPMVLWWALMAAFVIVPFGQPLHHPGPLFAGDRAVLIDHTDPKANLHILLSEPSRFITLPWRATQMFFHYEIEDMIAVFGPFQYWLPWHFDLAWIFGLLLAWLGLFFTARPATARQAGPVGAFFTVPLLCVVTYWFIHIMLYISWSDVGADFAQGFQGRYLVVFWPFLLLAVPAAFQKWRIPNWVPALPVIALGLFDLGYLPMQLAMDYYLH